MAAILVTLVLMWKENPNVVNADPGLFLDPPGGVLATVCAAQYAWPCGWALATSWCESRWQEAVVNPAGPYVGFFQILGGAADGPTNTAQAYEKWLAWQAGVVPNPWPVCGW